VADGVHARIHEGAYQLLGTLDLSDLFTGETVTVHKATFDRSLDLPPAPVMVLLVGHLQERPGPLTDSEQDSYKYPVLWLLRDKDPEDKEDKARYITARQRVRDLFKFGLPTVAEVQKAEIDFQMILKDNPIYQDVRSALLLWFVTKEPRTVVIP
jgi:hypothetical protein